MNTVTIQAAKTRLSELLARVEAGEEIILTRDNEPIAKLAPFGAAPTQRRFGAMKGRVTLNPEFFEPLREADLAGWE